MLRIENWYAHITISINRSCRTCASPWHCLMLILYRIDRILEVTPTYLLSIVFALAPYKLDSINCTGSRLSNMAANYWDSTQRTHWTFTKDQLDDIRSQQQQDNQELHSRFPLPESRLMNIYIQQREPVDSPKSTTQLIL